MTEMVKLKDTWGGGKYVSSTVLSKAQAGSPVAMAALSSVGYSVKDGNIVKVSTGETVKEIPKDEGPKVAKVESQPSAQVSVYDTKTLKPDSIFVPSPSEQFGKTAESKVWNPFAQQWISAHKTADEKKKAETPSVYSTTAPDIKPYKAPEDLKAGKTTSVVSSLPSGAMKIVEAEKERERESKVLEKVYSSYPMEYKGESKVAANIYKVDDYKDSLLSMGVDEKELEKRIEEAVSKGNELWVNPSTLQTFERSSNRIEVSSPFEAYAIASEYGIKDYGLVKVSEGVYDFTAKDFDLSKVKVPEYKVYSLEKDFANFIAPEFIREKSLKELVKEEGFKGLSKKIVKDSDIYQLKEGYYILEKDGKTFLLAMPKSEEEFKKLEDTLSKKFDEYFKSEMRRYQVERMVERGEPHEKALVYASTVGTSPIWSLGKYVFQGEKGVKEFAKEKAYSFASAKSPLEAGLKGALETETGLFSVTFLGSAGLATVGAYSKGLTTYVKTISDFYGKYKWVSKGVDVASAVGKPVVSAAKVALPVYVGVSMAPTVYYSATTGNWEPVLWSAKQMGVGVSGFVLGSKFPSKSSVEFSKRAEVFKSTHSAESAIKPLEDKYLIETKIRFGEEIGKGKNKEMSVYELGLGHTYVTKTGKVITEIPKVGAAPEQSLKMTVYPMPAKEYFKNVIFNKDFGTPERYLELRSASLIEGYRRTFLKPTKNVKFDYSVTFAGKEGKPVISETRKANVGFSKYGDYVIKEKYFSNYQYKNIDELLSKKIYSNILRGDVYVEPIKESEHIFRIKLPRDDKYQFVLTDKYKALATKYFSELEAKYPKFVKGKEMYIPRDSVQSIPSRTGFREIRYYYTEDEEFKNFLKPFRSDLPPRNVIKELSDYYKASNVENAGKLGGKSSAGKLGGKSGGKAVGKTEALPEQEVLYRITPKVVLKEELTPMITYQGVSLGIGTSLAVSSLLGRAEAEKLESLSIQKAAVSSLLGRAEAEKLEFKPLSIQKAENYPSLKMEMASAKIEPVLQSIELTPVQRQGIVQEEKLEIVPSLVKVPKEKSFFKEIYRFEGMPAFLPPIFLSRRQERKEPKGREIEEVRIEEPLVELKKVAATAYPDFYSAVVSQAVYGKATAPRFTPEQLERLREKGYIRVPTKEYKGIEDPNKVLKRIVGGAK